jgi:hypothetical protein
MTLRKLAFSSALGIALLGLAQARSPHDWQTQKVDTSQEGFFRGKRIPHDPAKSGQVREMTIKALGNFDYNAFHPAIPNDVRALNGSLIKLRGFMIPSTQSDHITHFLLVPSLFNCCYGRPPAIQHTVAVNCLPGQWVNYSPAEIVAEGTLSVGEIKNEGYVVSLFQLIAKNLANAPN